MQTIYLPSTDHQGLHNLIQPNGDGRTGEKKAFSEAGPGNSALPWSVTYSLKSKSCVTSSTSAKRRSQFRAKT